MRIVHCIVCGMEFQLNDKRIATCSSACRKERAIERNRRAYRRYRAANLEKLRAYDRYMQRLYYAADPERKRAIARSQYRKHREQKAEYKRRYNAANPEKRRAFNRQYYETHRERLKEYNRMYRFDNLEKVRANNRLQDARRKSALDIFRKLIGPCFTKDRDIAKQTLQQLTGGQPHDNATS